MNRIETFAIVDIEHTIKFNFSKELETGESLLSDVNSSLTTQGLTFKAVVPGATGDSITVSLVDPGALQAATTFSVTGSAITVTLQHDGANITATPDSVEADFASAPTTVTDLITIDSDGSLAVITPAAAANLSGGTDNQVLTLQEVSTTPTASVLSSTLLYIDGSNVVRARFTPDTVGNVILSTLVCTTSTGRTVVQRVHTYVHE